MAFNFSEHTQDNLNVNIPLSTYWPILKNLLNDKKYFYRIYKNIKQQILNVCQESYDKINMLKQREDSFSRPNRRIFYSKHLTAKYQLKTFYNKHVIFIVQYYILIPANTPPDLTLKNKKDWELSQLYVNIDYSSIIIKDGTRSYRKELSIDSQSFLQNYFNNDYNKRKRKFIE